MAGTALRRRLTWQVATVVEVAQETPTVRSLALDVPDWPGHLAGQHLDIRLTAPDGYHAERSYSIASAPGSGRVVITVQRVHDGEVSPYLVDEVGAGDVVEVRGPVGGYFVWTPQRGGPVQLVAGGSGIVPLMSMLRAHAAAGSDAQVRLLYSTRGEGEVIYRGELDALAATGTVDVRIALTRHAPPGWAGETRRVDGEMLDALAWPASASPLVYVCGPTPFVENVAELLVERSHDPASIRTERFGPAGGG